MITRYFVAAFIIALASFGFDAAAGLIVNENSTWPSTTAVETFPRTDANIESERDARFNRNLAQTFQAVGAFVVDKIFIDYEEGIAGKEITIRLYPVLDITAADPIADPVGAPLFSQTFTTTAAISTADAGNNQGAVLEFDLTGADEVLLPASVGTAGYAFQILRTGDGSTTDDTAERAFKWHFNDNDNLYAGGRAYAIGGGPGSTDDFLMAIQAVPEPGSASLACVAVAGLLARRRRRTH